MSLVFYAGIVNESCFFMQGLKNRCNLQSLHTKQHLFTISAYKTRLIYNPCLKNNTYLLSLHKDRVLIAIPAKKVRFCLHYLQKNLGSVYNPCEKNKAPFTIPAEKTRQEGALDVAIFGLWS